MRSECVGPSPSWARSWVGPSAERRHWQSRARMSRAASCGASWFPCCARIAVCVRALDVVRFLVREVGTAAPKIAHTAPLDSAFAPVCVSSLLRVSVRCVCAFETAALLGAGRRRTYMYCIWSPAARRTAPWSLCLDRAGALRPIRPARIQDGDVSPSSMPRSDTARSVCNGWAPTTNEMASTPPLRPSHRYRLDNAPLRAKYPASARQPALQPSAALAMLSGWR